TVLSVADEWGVSPEALRKWNRLKGNHLTRGRVLIIHRPLDSRNTTATGESGSHSSKKRNKSVETQLAASDSRGASRTKADGASPVSAASISKSHGSNSLQATSKSR